jgi:exodeoxyribonuclease V beta subunit
MTEERGEDLRLLYVALTRAKSQVVAWWAPSRNTPGSPLQRLLLHDDPQLPAPRSIDVPSDAGAMTAFRARETASGGGLTVEAISPRPRVRWTHAETASPPLELAVLARTLDAAWGRTSYSALTASAHETARLGSEPEVAPKDDEADLEEVDAGAPAGDERLRAVGSVWDELPGGPAFGTLVHAVFEDLSEGAGDDARVREAVAGRVARLSPDLDVDRLSSGISTAMATPLGPLAGDAALRDIPAADRLAELEFELPLAGGDEPRAVQIARVALSDLVGLWRAHCPDGPLSAYADALADLPAAPLRGYLTGSIDAVLRVDGPRYLVVDYKTNRLGGRDEPLSAWHYRAAAMERAMIEAHYPLQALLYSVALHRYLRWRQPGYDPSTHLGGVLYLFVRGMSGPGVPGSGREVPGVFSWRPPADLVTGFSDVLAGLR